MYRNQRINSNERCYKSIRFEAKMNNPLISVVTVSYNAVTTIEQTILSVINQTYSNIEYIIIDGGSTDGTVDIIRKYADRIAYWVSEPDKGIYDAMNKGTKKANGEYIAFLNSDDWYELDAVSIIAQFADGKNDLISGIIKLYKNDLFLYAHGSSMDNIYNEMIAHPSTFMKRDLFWELGGYDLSYKYVADYDLMLRLKKHGGHFVFVDKVIANFRLEGASSDVNSLLEKNILKRIYCKRSFWKYWLCRYFIRIYVAAL
ncbi:glycosyltransferase family 2 protein [Bacteroides sp. 3_1_40A]|nr:glycosyltransferase family 2 protein [Bacteroides sp. 3_1_40A]